MSMTWPPPARTYSTCCGRSWTPCPPCPPWLADSGYEGAGHGVHVPVKKSARARELDIDARTRNALLRSVRCLGERGFVLLTQRWQTLQHVIASPGKVGLIAKAALVLAPLLRSTPRRAREAQPG